MCKQIVRFFESNGKSEQFTFETYNLVVEQLCTPFKTNIYVYSVTVSAADTTIMLKKAAIEMIKKQIIGEKQRGTNNQANGANNKKAHARGKLTCPMTNDTKGFTALHTSTGKDVRLTKVAQKKKSVPSRRKPRILATRL
jgi:hypothetical protein